MKIDDLKPGMLYCVAVGGDVFRYISHKQGVINHNGLVNNADYKKQGSLYVSNDDEYTYPIQEEKEWFEQCERADRFISKEVSNKIGYEENLMLSELEIGGVYRVLYDDDVEEIIRLDEKDGKGYISTLISSFGSSYMKGAKTSNFYGAWIRNANKYERFRLLESIKNDKYFPPLVWKKDEYHSIMKNYYDMISYPPPPKREELQVTFDTMYHSIESYNRSYPLIYEPSSLTKFLNFFKEELQMNDNDVHIGLKKGQIYHAEDVKNKDVKFVFQYNGKGSVDGQLLSSTYMIEDATSFNGLGMLGYNKKISISSIILRDATIFEKMWLATSVEKNDFVDRNDVPMLFDESSIDEILNKKEEIKETKTKDDLLIEDGYYYAFHPISELRILFKFSGTYRDGNITSPNISYGISKRMNVKDVWTYHDGTNFFSNMNEYGIRPASRFEEHWIDESHNNIRAFTKREAMSSFSFATIEEFLEHEKFLSSDYDKYITFDNGLNQNYPDMPAWMNESLMFFTFSKKNKRLPIFKIRTGRNMDQIKTLLNGLLEIDMLQLMDEDGLRKHHTND